MLARTAIDVYVELCEEDQTDPGDEHRCGKLKKSMHGIRGHFGSRAISVQVNIEAVLAHLLHRFLSGTPVPSVYTCLH